MRSTKLTPLTTRPAWTSRQDDAGREHVATGQGLLVCKGEVRLKLEGEAVLDAGTHDERMIALKDLEIVHLAVVSAVIRIGGDSFRSFH